MEPNRRSLRGGNTAKARVSICVACVNKAGRKGRHGRRALVYALWGLRPSSMHWVRETYRNRFGIESSYRQMNQGRARTCSRDPVFRLLLIGIAFLLRNVWVWFHLVRSLIERPEADCNCTWNSWTSLHRFFASNGVPNRSSAAQNY